MATGRYGEGKCSTCGSGFPLTSPTRIYCDRCRTEINAQKRRGDHQRRRNRAVERGQQMNREASLGISFLEMPQPTMAWTITVRYPFAYKSLSKNSMHRIGHHGMVLRGDARRALSEIESTVREALATAGITPVQSRLWLWLFVQKPNHYGDAINVLDLVADAVKKATGVDDRLFCIGGVDWEISYEDPQVFIRIGQVSRVEQKICSTCGILRDLEEFWLAGTTTPSGRSANCKYCLSNYGQE